jgi:hypothetical protein
MWSAMLPVRFRCPNTGLHVHEWMGDDAASEDEEVYHSLLCAACQGLHLVNPITGKVLGAEEG